MTATTTPVDPWANPEGSPDLPAQVVITSFGYRHAGPPAADLTVDARRVLRDPHTSPAMRQRTGRSPKVRRHVLVTPGARELIRHTVVCALDLMLATGWRITIATGSTGGRHRSVVLAEEIARLIRREGITAAVHHRDVDKPVLPASTTGGGS
ncbi:RapZ C-terminal domain-containing protein [Streptosporangium sp. V21-05]|uniref:RapZ C-terminal domain-containing protein n=1 Tax=Streptosporangium sp. V21-05 TaxID=3446115 RepID=UPI003F537144